MVTEKNYIWDSFLCISRKLRGWFRQNPGFKKYWGLKIYSNSRVIKYPAIYIIYPLQLQLGLFWWKYSRFLSIYVTLKNERSIISHYKKNKKVKTIIPFRILYYIGSFYFIYWLICFHNFKYFIYSNLSNSAAYKQYPFSWIFYMSN